MVIGTSTISYGRDPNVSTCIVTETTSPLAHACIVTETTSPLAQACSHRNQAHLPKHACPICQIQQEYNVGGQRLIVATIPHEGVSLILTFVDVSDLILCGFDTKSRGDMKYNGQRIVLTGTWLALRQKWDWRVAIARKSEGGRKEGGIVQKVVISEKIGQHFPTEISSIVCLSHAQRQFIIIYGLYTGNFTITIKW